LAGCLAARTSLLAEFHGFFPRARSFFAFAHSLEPFLCGQRQQSFRAVGKFLVDERVGAAEFVFDCTGPQNIPTLHGDPPGFGEIGRGDDPFRLEQLVKTLRAAMEPQDAGSGAVEVGHGEHFAAAVAIADPVDEVVSPIDGLGDMGKGETNSPDALVVHGGQCMPELVSEEARLCGHGAGISGRALGLRS
jgi:hypothetical protein